MILIESCQIQNGNRSLKTKTWKVMKLTIALLLFFTFQAGAGGYAQRITIVKNNVHLAEVFRVIEQQTGYLFFYDKSLIQETGPLNVTIKNATLDEALTVCLKDQHLTYTIIKNTVVIRKEKKNFSAISQNISLKVEAEEIPPIQVHGTVKDENGNPLLNASVIIKGSQIGVTTNNEGRFNISVPSKNTVLVVSFTGYASKEILVGERTEFAISLERVNNALNEVVVTALGIKRQSKSLGYSATSIDTKEITSARTTNVGNSLVGKVAGLNVSIPTSGPGGASKIRIRGQSSFGGNNSPLIVVNGVPINNDIDGGANGNKEGFAGEANSDEGDGLQSINPDDIESMTVLKGAAAAALYGFRAKDGAIIITTKSGHGQVGIGVELNSNFQADFAIDYTDFQYEYGQGENGIRNESVADARRTGTWSFGTKFDGQPVWQVDGTQKPYVPFKERISTFYRPGINLTNSIALSGGDANGGFRLSFANTDANAIIPNSKINKKILNLGLNYKLSKKLSTQINANYSIESLLNPPVINQETFNVNNVVYTSLANSINPDWLKNVYKDSVTGNEIGISRFTPRTNPYWAINERHEEHKRDRIFGNASLRYQLTNWLYAQGRVGQDYFSIAHNVNVPTGTAALGPAASGFNGNFYQDAESFREVNLDFLIGGNKKFGSFGIDATVGGNSMDQKRQTLSTSVTNFYVRDLYTINNGQIKEPNFIYSQKRVNSLYATVDFSYNDYLFLNGTARNDWFSTLNPKSNHYLYPSVSLSFLFSEAFAESMPSWLNYGKIRAAYAEVGGDTDPYTNSLFYSLSTNSFDGVPLGNISGSVSPNPNLKPLKVKEAEVGLELSILDRRFNLDIAAYRKNTVDEILNVDISNASGFGQTKVNAGRLRNQGLEMLLSFVPVRNKHLKWESSINYTYNQSKVLELANGQQKIDIGTGNFIGIASEEVGKPMGSIRGVDYRRDEQGRIITVNGRFLAGDIVTYGSSIPKYTGGFLNTITFNGFRFFSQFDFKGGNKIISNTNFNLMRHGLHKASLVGRENGVIFAGYNTDGTPNSTAVEAESFYSDYRGKSLTTPFVYDASFIKWRTLSLGYDFTRFVNNSFIKGLNLNAFINNVLVIKKHIDNLDPESQFSASDLLGGLESLALPTTRSYGLNLNVKF